MRSAFNAANLFVCFSLLLLGAKADGYDRKPDQSNQDQVCWAHNQGSAPRTRYEEILKRQQTPSASISNRLVQQRSSCFRAAVLEHNRIETKNCRRDIEANLEIFSHAAELAAKQGAKIIVFPEDGILKPGRIDDVRPHMVEIPNPEMLNQSNNNPCLQPDKFQDKSDDRILIKLSCMARKNSIYIVANFGTKQTCKPKTKVADRECPDVGYLVLNTNVVLDAYGNYMRRYRKFNMFIEIFDKAPSLEMIHFNTPFGRFGIFTCFDILFKRPAIELVEEFKIDSVLYPTWWYDELPLLTALQIQDAWSQTNKVNLLASNIHIPRLGSLGSGLYTANSSLYTGAKKATRSRLLLASLPKRYSQATECSEEFSPVILDIETSQENEKYKYKHYMLTSSDTIFTFKEMEGKKTICSQRVCCTIDYKINKTKYKDLDDKLILFARDNVRPGTFQWWEQVCSLATLEQPFNSDKLNETRFSSEPIANFESLSLETTFNSKYVFPIAAHRVNHLVKREEREFNCDHSRKETKDVIECRLTINNVTKKSALNVPIYSFAMYGRLYESDRMPEWWI